MRETRTKKTGKKLKVILLLFLSLILVAVAVCVAVVGGNYVSNRNFKETFYNVSSLKVNNKIRVIQISDLHSCTYGTQNSDILNRVSKLKPDIIILTGDCIDSTSGNVDEIVSFCSKLSDIAPSYYIYGNNEIERFYGEVLTQENLDRKFGFDDSNRDPEKLFETSDSFEQKLEEGGVKVLKNEMDTLKVGTTTVDVYGVFTSNPSAFWSYGGESFDSFIYTNQSNLKITAIHEPLVFEEFGDTDTWGDLIVAGHTHGGTAKIPVLGPAYTPEGGFLPARSGCLVYGRYDVQGSPLIISAGLENKNLLRINNPPEIVIVDINRF